MLPALDKVPRSLMVCEKSNFLQEKSRHETCVSKHSFNYKISLLIPECGALPVEMQNVISNFSSFYLVRDLPVYKFLEERFLETFAKKGGIYALSYKTQIDEDNVFALLSSGELILSLNRDTYQHLGLEGKPSAYNHRTAMRYIVMLNLKDKSLMPGSKRYKQVLLSLKERLPLKSEFLLTRGQPEGDSDETLKDLLSEHEYKECKLTFNTQNLKGLLCPTLDPSDLQGKSLSCTPEEFLEWLGALSLNISCDNSAAEFLSTYACPEPRTCVSQALFCTLAGFIPPENVCALLKEIRQCLDQLKFSSWVSLTVHGFMDSPVSWGTSEHGFLKGGENFYNFVCFKNQNYWLQMATGAHDGCPP